ncbi:unnamed protein product [Trichogramma brassicae]|uniref:Uncharacterized protein n=1 Tax=Trichogramma brassicae TaxID=86971 RepID=A0A6H5HZS7_9HYME|nr:unnamed protein product [Trichogramma brassicae]
MFLGLQQTIMTRLDRFEDRLDFIIKTQHGREEVIARNAKDIVELSRRLSSELTNIQNRQVANERAFADLQEKITTTIATSTTAPAPASIIGTADCHDDCEVRLSGLPARLNPCDITNIKHVLAALGEERLLPHVIRVREWKVKPRTPATNTAISQTDTAARPVPDAKDCLLRFASANARETFLAAAPRFQHLPVSKIFELSDTEDALKCDEITPVLSVRLWKRSHSQAGPGTSNGDSTLVARFTSPVARDAIMSHTYQIATTTCGSIFDTVDQVRHRTQQYQYTVERVDLRAVHVAWNKSQAADTIATVNTMSNEQSNSKGSVSSAPYVSQRDFSRNYLTEATEAERRALIEEQYPGFSDFISRRESFIETQSVDSSHSDGHSESETQYEPRGNGQQSASVDELATMFGNTNFSASSMVALSMTRADEVLVDVHNYAYGPTDNQPTENRSNAARNVKFQSPLVDTKSIESSTKVINNAARPVTTTGARAMKKAPLNDRGLLDGVASSSPNAGSNNNPFFQIDNSTNASKADDELMELLARIGNYIKSRNQGHSGYDGQAAYNQNNQEYAAPTQPSFDLSLVRQGAHPVLRLPLAYLTTS